MWKSGFVLEGDFALVEAGGRTGFSESGDKIVESTRWTSDKECPGDVAEGCKALNCRAHLLGAVTWGIKPLRS